MTPRSEPGPSGQVERREIREVLSRLLAAVEAGRVEGLVLAVHVDGQLASLRFGGREPAGLALAHAVGVLALEVPPRGMGQ